MEVSEQIFGVDPNDVTLIKDPIMKKYKKTFHGTWVTNFGQT
jgi:hypothetical protein